MKPENSLNVTYRISQTRLPDSYFDSFKTPKNIRYISASTENAQARFLPEWIRTTFSNSEYEEKRKCSSTL